MNVDRDTLLCDVRARSASESNAPWTGFHFLEVAAGEPCPIRISRKWVANIILTTLFFSSTPANRRNHHHIVRSLDGLFDHATSLHSKESF